MLRVVKSCLQVFMKVVNLVYVITGIAMIMYSLWMFRVLQYDHTSSTLPWFIYAFMGAGITLCAITCLGFIAADTANYHCLTCYMIIVCSILLLEVLVIADLVLNPDWEKDFPEDPSGRFDDFKDFVSSNFDICQWVGFSLIFTQGLSILSAIVLRTLDTHQIANYESTYDYAPGLPLLNPQPFPYSIGEPYFPPKNETWKVQTHNTDKGCFFGKRSCS